MPISLDSLVIEVTRNCNLECEHCLRGEPENKSVDIKSLELLFSEIDYISNLTLSGGEPLLDPYSLDLILTTLKKHNVGIGTFYLATNATVCSDKALLTLVKYWLYMQENLFLDEIRCVEWSNDDYHYNDPAVISKLKALAFAGPKYSTEYSFRESYVIPEGRASAWGTNEKSGPYRIDIEDYYDDDTENRIEGTLYLNCDGWLINDCDWSYDTQRKRQDVQIVHIPTWKGNASKHNNLSLVDIINEYNSRHFD